MVWGQKAMFKVKRHLKIGHFVIFQFFFVNSSTKSYQSQFLLYRHMILRYRNNRLSIRRIPPISFCTQHIFILSNNCMWHSQKLTSTPPLLDTLTVHANTNRQSLREYRSVVEWIKRLQLKQ